jgi:hypothetical protein
MKSIFSKAAIVAVIVACFAFNVQASVHVSPADTGKMSKMSKMDKKMDKKPSSKMAKKSKMAKDTSKM